MTAGNTESTVEETIREMICEVLAVEKEDVTPTARWYGDLGGESIEVLDLAFRCERRYRIKVPINKIIGPADFGPQGQLKPESVARLKRQFPSAGLESALAGDRPVNVQDLLTVGMITEFIKQQIAEAAAGQAASAAT